MTFLQIFDEYFKDTSSNDFQSTSAASHPDSYVLCVKMKHPAYVQPMHIEFLEEPIPVKYVTKVYEVIAIKDAEIILQPLDETGSKIDDTFIAVPTDTNFDGWVIKHRIPNYYKNERN